MKSNLLVHIAHYFKHYTAVGWEIPVLVLVVEVMTSGCILWLRIYWGFRGDDCTNDFSFVITMMFITMSYFYLFRILFAILIPCIMVVAILAFLCIKKYKEGARIRQFNRFRSYTFGSIQHNTVKYLEWCIWLEEYGENTEVVEVPWDNKHIFHKQWLQMWWEKNNTCPIDRQHII